MSCVFNSARSRIRLIWTAVGLSQKKAREKWDEQNPESKPLTPQAVKQAISRMREKVGSDLWDRQLYVYLTNFLRINELTCKKCKGDGAKCRACNGTGRYRPPPHKSQVTEGVSLLLPRMGPGLFWGYEEHRQRAATNRERCVRRTRCKRRDCTQVRNDAGFWLACQLRDNRYSRWEAESAMKDYASRVPSTNTKGVPEPYSEGEALASLQQAYSRQPREPWQVSADVQPAARPRPLAPAAFHGLVGQFVRTVEPHTEAAPWASACGDA